MGRKQKTLRKNKASTIHAQEAKDKACKLEKALNEAGLKTHISTFNNIILNKTIIEITIYDIVDPDGNFYSISFDCDTGKVITSKDWERYS